jgi:hypothetical protein
VTHLSPTTNPIATRVDDDVDADHTIVVPPEDRCLVVLPEPMLGHAAEIVAILEGQPSPPARKPRKPSLRRQIAAAEKATGKSVTSVTLPDGTKLGLDEPQPTNKSGNPWDVAAAALRKDKALQ